MLPEDEQFLEWVHGYCKWYEREARRWQRALVACKWLSLLSSLLAVVVAAVISKEFFQPWGKILILGGTLLSATSFEFLAQFQVRRMEELRESGNLETAHLFAYTRDKFTEFEGPTAWPQPKAATMPALWPGCLASQGSVLGSPRGALFAIGQPTSPAIAASPGAGPARTTKPDVCAR